MEEKINQRISVYEQELNKLYIENIKLNDDVDGDSHLMNVVNAYIVLPTLLIILFFYHSSMFLVVVYFVVSLGITFYLINLLNKEYPGNPETRKVKLWLITILGIYPLGTIIEGARLKKRIKTIWPHQKRVELKNQQQQYENRIMYLKDSRFMEDTLNKVLSSQDPGFVIDLARHEIISRQEYATINQYFGNSLPPLW